MKTYETISLVIALGALAISVASLVLERKIQARQRETEAVTVALAKKQLDLLKKDEQIQGKANLTAELVKVGGCNYRFVVMNHGPASATEVIFEVDPASPDNPLVLNERTRKLPYPSLQPGQSFTLIAALHMGSAMSYSTHLKWKNEDGSRGTISLHLSV